MEKQPPNAPELTSAEYFDNLRKMLKEDCALHNRRTDCHSLAQFIQTVDKDFPEALNRYETLCHDREHGPSCFELGQMHLLGQGTSRSPSRAFALFSEACGRGAPEGCNNAGMLARAGADGVEKDGARALKFFHKACDEQAFPNSCFMLNVMYLVGQCGVKKDLPRAFHYAEKACNYGHAWGCVNASRMARIGDGVEKNPEKAEAYKRKAQELSEETRIM